LHLQENTILYSYDSKYYLKAGMIPATAILEYAEIVKSTSLIESRIKEFGNLISESDVVNTINMYFNKKKRKTKKQPV
jgi:negative regulator of genetic competence, sporulation and motility